MEALKRRIGRSSRHQIRLIFMVFIVIAGVFASYISLKTVDNTDKAITEQNQKRLLVLARSGALQIQFFLSALSREIITLNKIDEVSRLSEKETREIFQNYIDQIGNESPLVALGRLDKKGKLIIAANRERIRTNEGTSLADREYFIWSKEALNKGKVYISKPIVSRAGATKGKMIMTIANPSYYKNEFTGVTYMVVLLDRSIETFIKPLKTNQNSKVFITDSKGVVMIGESEFSALLNKSILDYAKSAQWKGWDNFVYSFNNVLKQEEGIASWDFQYPGGELKKGDIIAFKTLRVGDQEAKLIIVKPKDFMEESIRDVLSLQNKGKLLMILGFTLGGILFVLIDQLGHRDGYLKGYRDGLDELLGGKKKGK